LVSGGCVDVEQLFWLCIVCSAMQGGGGW